MAGERLAVPFEKPHCLVFAHSFPQPEQQLADPVRGLTGRIFEYGKLLDLVDHTETILGTRQENGGVLHGPAGSGQVAEVRRR